MSLKSHSLSAEKLEEYHSSADEQARTADLMSLVPRGYATVLDAGSREGYYSALLAGYFDSVTALDLVMPTVKRDRVVCVQGDITKLDFPDRSFDVVFCTEVLEHVPALDQACREIMRVAKHAIVIGVPYKQDTRIARTTCQQCGRIAPPWGHVNSFDEARLERLFHPWKLLKKSFAGENRERTNALATWLTDAGGNPYGVYEDQTCMYCGSAFGLPKPPSFAQKVCAGTALRLTRLSTRFSPVHGNWIHVLFERPGT